ncbi:MAG TPA: carboxypeptidase regulatory-like domain-containing protein [Blastocatellia bacterium]|nr:carboxypeptidase regulatory-like domain-containing protein [Blastocatellia bacterium]
MRSGKYVRSRMLLLLLSLLLPPATTAQTTSGSISGSVTDAQQAAIANATVTITDEAKGFSQTTKTDSEGRFVFPQLTPGKYVISAEASGFKKLQKTDVNLVANDKLTLGELQLETGTTNEVVTVTAAATQIQAESAERSYAIQGEAVRNIAVNGRGFTPLASIVPGIVFQGVSSGSSDQVAQISANGLRVNNNNLQLDGISIMDTGNNGTLLNISLDSIAEFKVLTSNYQAEYGRSAGAQLSAVTRSGTQDFHGSFYAFRRHDGMNANTWLNNRDSTATTKINKPRLDQRDLGYTIGGPVYIPKVLEKTRENLFFFWSQEYQKRFIPPAGPTRVTVPTGLERAGDFSKSVDNAGNPFPYIRDYTTGLPCSASNTSGCFKDGGVLGKIPANRLYGLGVNILKIYPMPNATGVGFNYVTEAPTNQPERQDLFRMDWNISSKWRASGRYVNNTSDRLLAYGSFVLGDNLPDYPAQFLFPRRSWSITTTRSLNPTTILEGTVGVSHNSIDILPGNDKFNRAGLGLTGFPTLFPNAIQLDLPPQFIFGGRINAGPNVGSNNAPFTNFNTVRTVSASLSKIWRGHNLKTGMFWENSFKPQSSFANNNGQINFSNDSSNPFDSGFGFANAALGIYNNYTQASGYFIGKYRYNNVEWFVQDNWKVRDRLTLDYGVRFYVIQPQYDEDAQTANFLPDKFNPNDAPLLYRPVCIGVSPCSGANRRAVDPRLLGPGFVPGPSNTIDGVYIGRLVPNTGKLLNGVFRSGDGIEKGLFKNRGVLFAPRFGFAYDVTGREQIVIRGGGGMFYDRPQGNVVFDLLANPPTTIQPTLNFGRLQDIGSGQVLLAPPALVAYDHEGDSPTTYAFNLGVQYKLPYESVLDVSYVGTIASHLLQRRNLNAPSYGAAYLAKNQDPTLAASTIPGATALAVDFLRPYQGFGNISYIEPASSSNYHSLQVSLNRRFSKGLLLGVNYAWSKAMGTQANDLPAINGFGAPRSDNNQRTANYAPQDFNRPHNFNVNWVYQLPNATENHLLSYALNNWQLSGIYRYQSGAPYNIAVSIPGISAYTLTGTQTIEGARVALVGNPGSGHSSDPYRQFNTAAFAAPKPGSIGLESGRNFLTRNPINSWDLSLAKRFRIRERGSIEIRLDTFNTFNQTQFDNVNSTLVVRSLTDPTPTNLPFDANGNLVNKNGFGTVSSVRPPRNMQLSLHLEF